MAVNGSLDFRFSASERVVFDEEVKHASPLPCHVKKLIKINRPLSVQTKSRALRVDGAIECTRTGVKKGF